MPTLPVDEAFERRLRENLATIQGEIRSAAQAAGRAASSVRLIAVTKYVGVEQAAAVVRAGCRELGESRPQELWAKAESMQALGVQWHLIGPLQTNKIARTIPHVGLIHSVDRLRLLAALEAAAAALGQAVRILLEVNISGDASKHGFVADQLPAALAWCESARHVRVEGLMGMAGLTATLAERQRQFASLRLLRERLVPQAPSQVRLEELSMGMSGDFTIAVREGATLVRVGSALFEGLLP